MKPRAVDSISSQDSCWSRYCVGTLFELREPPNATKYVCSLCAKGRSHTAQRCRHFVLRDAAVRASMSKNSDGKPTTTVCIIQPAATVGWTIAPAQCALLRSVAAYKASSACITKVNVPASLRAALGSGTVFKKFGALPDGSSVTRDESSSQLRMKYVAGWLGKLTGGIVGASTARSRWAEASYGAVSGGCRGTSTDVGVVLVVRVNEMVKAFCVSFVAFAEEACGS